MRSIGVFTVWMGSLPDYFEVWMKTVGENPTVTFNLITDQSMRNDIPDNIKWINMSFDEVKKKLQELFDFKIELKYPYKLCDYKPIFAKAFFEYAKEFDFVGYCDIDVAFGDIRRFITDSMLENNERILDAGHFCIYRNNQKMNDIYLLSDKKEYHVYSYKDVYRTGYACYFDEFLGMGAFAWKLCKTLVDRQDENLVFDFTYKKFDFTSYITGKTYCCCWDNGKLYKYEYDKETRKIICSDLEKTEIMYIHYQQRHMKVMIDPVRSDKFWIIPNRFVETINPQMIYNAEEKAAYEASLYANDRKKKINNIKRNGILKYVKHYIKKTRILKHLYRENGTL